MKSTGQFKNVIEAHLKQRASIDPLFDAVFKKENKNIDDCLTYILNTVQKSGCNGFTDDEIFGMAVHYYDEDKIDVGKPVKARVVVNHQVETEKQVVKKNEQAAVPTPKSQRRKSDVTQLGLFE